jgi:Tfp pilus assembly PilM family ATPase
MRILGLDCGSSSIKAVEIDSAFGRYDIHDYHECPITAEMPIAAAIRKIIQSLPKPPDRVVMSMPIGKTTFRTLSLPTRDKKSIQSSVGFELEDELPFAIDACTYDYVILSQNKQGSQVHIAATLKSHVQTVLDFCKIHKLDPDTLTTEEWSYRTLLNRIIQIGAQEAPVLLKWAIKKRFFIYIGGIHPL